MKITCSKRSQPVEAGLFNRKKKDDKAASMQEYLDKVNKAGGKLDKMQEKAMKKYGNVNSDTDVDPVEYEDIEYIEVHLDADIVIAEDGSWEYADTDYTWARPDERSTEWYSEEYPDVLLDDHIGVVERVDDLIIDSLPDDPGQYHVVGDVTLAYEISRLDKYTQFDGYDEDDSPIVNEYANTDNADASYLMDESSIENFECSSVSINSSTAVSAAVTFDKSKPFTGSRYGMYTSAQYNGTRFSIYYNEIDTSPEADGMDMFNTFKAQISENHPYDDGEYLSAVLEKGVINYRLNGKQPVKQSFYFTPDDMGVENEEWCTLIIEQAIEELRELNKSVEPRMVHY